MKWVPVVLMLTTSFLVEAQELQDIKYPSSADNTMQSAMFHDPEPEQPVPLVVALHTWSGDYRQKHHEAIREWCMKKGWAYIHPDFRGPARRPEATGSELVIGDIVSAVAHARKVTKIDSEAVFLVAVSYTHLTLPTKA